MLHSTSNWDAYNQNVLHIGLRSVTSTAGGRSICLVAIVFVQNDCLVGNPGIVAARIEGVFLEHLLSIHSCDESLPDTRHRWSDILNGAPSD